MGGAGRRGELGCGPGAEGAEGTWVELGRVEGSWGGFAGEGSSRGKGPWVGGHVSNKRLKRIQCIIRVKYMSTVSHMHVRHAGWPWRQCSIVLSTDLSVSVVSFEDETTNSNDDNNGMGGCRV